MERTTDLGMPCPACGSHEGFYPGQLWNSWQCVACMLPSSIRDGLLEIVPLEGLVSRTEEDRRLDRERPEKPSEWSKSNRAICNFLHRQIFEA